MIIMRCYVVEINSPIGYQEGLVLQRKAFELVKSGQVAGILFLLQHRSVFTIGTQGGRDNLFVAEDELDKMGIELFETQRGGNITYHGPGQLVAYPILNLSYLKKDVRWYIYQLEEVVIQTLRGFGITAGRKAKYIGVWVGDQKIAAIGVGMKKWITLHGLAFNIQVSKQIFSLINPCGIKEFAIASLDDFIEPIDYKKVVNCVKERFSSVFNLTLASKEADFLRGFEGDEYATQSYEKNI